MGKIFVSCYRHIPNEFQTYTCRSQFVQTFALQWPDYDLPGNIWECPRNMIKSLKCLPVFLSVVTPKCLECGIENARTTVIQVRKLNVLFLLEQIGFLPSGNLLFFYFRRRSNLHEGNNSKKFWLNNRTRRNYMGVLSVDGAKVDCRCVYAGCTLLVEDGAQWQDLQ